MKKYAKVEGYPNLIRDLDTNAIINTDSISASTYDKSRELRKIKEQEIQDIKTDISDLKSSLNEIKNLLKEITNGS